MRVSLSRATEWLSVHLDPRLAWEAGTVEIPGTECPIAVGDLELEAKPEPAQTIVRLRLPRGRYRLVFGNLTQVADVPGRDVHFPDPTVPTPGR